MSNGGRLSALKVSTRSVISDEFVESAEPINQGKDREAARGLVASYALPRTREVTESRFFGKKASSIKGLFTS